MLCLRFGAANIHFSPVLRRFRDRGSTRCQFLALNVCGSAQALAAVPSVDTFLDEFSPSLCNCGLTLRSSFFRSQSYRVNMNERLILFLSDGFIGRPGEAGLVSDRR